MSEFFDNQTGIKLPAAPSPLTAPVLFWTCNDSCSLVAVTISQFLEGRAKLRHQRLSLQQLANQSGLGLSAYAIYESSQLTETIQGIMQTCRQYPHAFQLVFLQPELIEARLALVEAGAQSVVHQISSIARVLEKCLPSMSLSHEGLHPITTGLVARLPWSFADVDF